MKPIIKVENLGKMYRIGARQASYHTLRETIAGAMQAPFKRLRRNGAENSRTIWALKAVSFEVMPGEVVGIVGRNGAGKSTLLKVLSRITEPTTGRVEIYGRIASLLEVGTGFHPELTGRENMYLNGAVLGMKRSEIERKFDEIVAFAEIEKFLDTPVKHYSSGMYMRLAFAVAAHLEPDILLVDEVLAVGDIEFQKKCLAKMDDVAKHGRTVLFVSHAMTAIAKLCTRTILLGDGEIAQEGNTERVIDYYLKEVSPASNEGFTAINSEKQMFIAQARALDDRGEQKSCFTHDEDLVVAITCKINRWVPNTVMGFNVTDHRGRKVFTTNNPEWADLEPRTGEVNVTARIPGHFLVPGRYVFAFGLDAPGYGSLDWVEDVLPIVIVDGGSEFAAFEGADYGCVFASCEWNVEKAAPREMVHR